MPTITIVPPRPRSERPLLDGAARPDRDDDVVGSAPARVRR